MFKLILQVDILTIFCEIYLQWIPPNPIDDM